MRQYFQAISKEMTARVEGMSEFLRHPGMKGAGSEQLIRTFLRKYLPQRYRIGQGKVVDCQGTESRQVDVMIIDSATAVPLYVDDENWIMPIESVYATIEIKTTLSSKSMSDAIDNMLSVRYLEIPSNSIMQAEEYLLEKHRIPFGYIFAFGPENHLPYID